LALKVVLSTTERHRHFVFISRPVFDRKPEAALERINNLDKFSQYNLDKKYQDQRVISKNYSVNY